MDSADAALDRLCDPETEVSAHYLICEAGRIYQLVEEDLRAEAIEWQATRGSRSGRVAWQYVTDLAGRQGVVLR